MKKFFIGIIAIITLSCGELFNVSEAAKVGHEQSLIGQNANENTYLETMLVQELDSSSDKAHTDTNNTITYVKWKLFWPNISAAHSVEIGMTFMEVKEILGLPQYNMGSGLIREVYYLNNGQAAHIYYYLNDNGETVVGKIDIISMFVSGNLNYYILTGINALILLSILALIIFIAVKAIKMLKRRRSSRTKLL